MSVVEAPLPLHDILQSAAVRDTARMFTDMYAAVVASTESLGILNPDYIATQMIYGSALQHIALVEAQGLDISWQTDPINYFKDHFVPTVQILDRDFFMQHTSVPTPDMIGIRSDGAEVVAEVTGEHGGKIKIEVNGHLQGHIDVCTPPGGTPPHGILFVPADVHINKDLLADPNQYKKTPEQREAIRNSRNTIPKEERKDRAWEIKKHDPQYNNTGRMREVPVSEDLRNRNITIIQLPTPSTAIKQAIKEEMAKPGGPNEPSLVELIKQRRDELSERQGRWKEISRNPGKREEYRKANGLTPEQMQDLTEKMDKLQNDRRNLNNGKPSQHPTSPTLSPNQRRPNPPEATAPAALPKPLPKDSGPGGASVEIPTEPTKPVVSPLAEAFIKELIKEAGIEIGTAGIQGAIEILKRTGIGLIDLIKWYLAWREGNVMAGIRFRKEVTDPYTRFFISTAIGAGKISISTTGKVLGGIGRVAYLPFEIDQEKYKQGYIEPMLRGESVPNSTVFSGPPSHPRIDDLAQQYGMTPSELIEQFGPRVLPPEVRPEVEVIEEQERDLDIRAGTTEASERQNSINGRIEELIQGVGKIIDKAGNIIGIVLPQPSDAQIIDDFKGAVEELDGKIDEILDGLPDEEAGFPIIDEVMGIIHDPEANPDEAIDRLIELGLDPSDAEELIEDAKEVVRTREPIEEREIVQPVTQEPTAVEPGTPTDPPSEGRNPWFPPERGAGYEPPPEAPPDPTAEGGWLWDLADQAERDFEFAQWVINEAARQATAGTGGDAPPPPPPGDNGYYEYYFNGTHRNVPLSETSIVMPDGTVLTWNGHGYGPPPAALPAPSNALPDNSRMADPFGTPINQGDFIPRNS